MVTNEIRGQVTYILVYIQSESKSHIYSIITSPPPWISSSSSSSQIRYSGLKLSQQKIQKKPMRIEKKPIAPPMAKKNSKS